MGPVLRRSDWGHVVPRGSLTSNPIWRVRKGVELELDRGEPVELQTGRSFLHEDRSRASRGHPR